MTMTCMPRETLESGSRAGTSTVQSSLQSWWTMNNHFTFQCMQWMAIAIGIHVPTCRQHISDVVLISVAFERCVFHGFSQKLCSASITFTCQRQSGVQRMPPSSERLLSCLLESIVEPTVLAACSQAIHRMTPWRRDGEYQTYYHSPWFPHTTHTHNIRAYIHVQ